MDPIYSAEQIRIPPELPDILKNYAKHIIKTQPVDILEASQEYFLRLSNQGNMVDGKLGRMQLEVLYSKFTANNDDLISVKALEAACKEAGITSNQMSDIIALGKWKKDHLPWLQFWTLLVASCAGSLISTVQLAGEICGDNGQVQVNRIKDIYSFLVEQDPTIVETDAFQVKHMLETNQNNLIELSQVIQSIQTALGTLHGIPTVEKKADTTPEAELENPETTEEQKMDVEESTVQVQQIPPENETALKDETVNEDAMQVEEQVPKE